VILGFTGAGPCACRTPWRCSSAACRSLCPLWPFVAKRLMRGRGDDPALYHDGMMEGAAAF
jgi:hypothetical protein